MPMIKTPTFPDGTMVFCRLNKFYHGYVQATYWWWSDNADSPNEMLEYCTVKTLKGTLIHDVPVSHLARSKVQLKLVHNSK